MPVLLFFFSVLLCLSQPLLAAQAQLEVAINEALSLSFVQIPAGSFTLGDAQGQADEKPLQPVKLAAFYMQRHEISRAQYAAFAKQQQVPSRGCWYFNGKWQYDKKLNWQNPGYAQAPNEPAVCISWQDVKAYINWLNSHSKAYFFRLPSEAEWEYAARAGSASTYFWGEKAASLCDYANSADQSILRLFPNFSAAPCHDGFERSAPVGSFLANPWGLYDVYGNAWEWVQDCWNERYDKSRADGQARQSGDCARRVFRGGGWGDIPRFARSGIRNRTAAHKAKDDIGFRLVVELR